MKFNLIKILTLTAFVSLITAFVCFQAGCFGTKTLSQNEVPENEAISAVDTTQMWVIFPSSKSITLIAPQKQATFPWNLYEVDTFEMRIDKSGTSKRTRVFSLDYKVDTVEMKTKLMNTSKSGVIFSPERKADTAKKNK